jgi:hypothetical protein
LPAEGEKVREMLTEAAETFSSLLPGKMEPGRPPLINIFSALLTFFKTARKFFNQMPQATGRKLK